MSKINDKQLDKAREINDFDIYFDGNAPDRDTAKAMPRKICISPDIYALIPDIEY